MSPEKFLVLNGGVVILLAVYFLWSKSEKTRPSQLNLRRGNLPSGNKSTAMDFTSEEELNVFFNHNGMLFDAFEVLGVPAGSPMERVEKAYQDSLKQVDKESEDIIRRAFQAIQERVS